MKRDMDLCRNILAKVEEFPFDGRFYDVAVANHSDEEISYHVMLLNEAGFVDAIDLTTHSGVCWKPKRLTYTGHEFIDAARSDTVWEKAKSVVLKSTGTLTLEGLKMALPLAVKSLMEAKTG